MTNTRTVSLIDLSITLLWALKRPIGDLVYRRRMEASLGQALQMFLSRQGTRFRWLLARAQAGVVAVPRGPMPEGWTRATRPPLPADRVRWKWGYGWLCRLVPMHAASFGRQMLHLLMHDAEFAALVAGSPELARQLRAMFRMTGNGEGMRILGPLPPKPRRARLGRDGASRGEAARAARAVRAEEERLPPLPRFSAAALSRQGKGPASVEVARIEHRLEQARRRKINRRVFRR